MAKVITRFAPSPTGTLHIGVARTALFNYLFAKKNNGEFLLRIEDTDKERSKKEYEENIFSSLKWLGIKEDKEVVYQSKFETEFKKTILEKMIEAGFAYEGEESKDGNGKKVIRLKNPNEEIKFNDLIHGEININTTDLGDFIIAKDMDSPLYHLAVVADDIQMGITHIIRGEDHISNTPRQLLIYKAINESVKKIEIPEYVHIPLILASNRSKLSKRNGSISIDEYKNMGYLSDAIVNFIALIGWNPGTKEELFSIEDLISSFSIENINKSGAIFDEKKLNWMNREYIKRLSYDDFIKTISEYPGLNKLESIMNKYIVEIIKERIDKILDIKEMLDTGDLDYLFSDPSLNFDILKDPKSNSEKDSVLKHLLYIESILKKIEDKDFDNKNIKNILWNYATNEGRGEVLWPMRTSLTGLIKSPDPFIVASAIGKEKTLNRIKKAINILNK